MMRIPQGQGLAKFRSFWRGMGVTLAKDVPFAAAYWSVLEPLRSTMLPEDACASTAQVQCHTLQALSQPCCAIAHAEVHASCAGTSSCLCVAAHGAASTCWLMLHINKTDMLGKIVAGDRGQCSCWLWCSSSHSCSDNAAGCGQDPHANLACPPGYGQRVLADHV